MPGNEHGPFASGQEASATRAVREARAAWTSIVAKAAIDHTPVAGKHVPLHLKIMTDALEAGGVEIAAWELGTFRWLANYEDTTCQVIAGVIARAYQSGAAAAAARTAGETL